MKLAELPFVFRLPLAFQAPLLRYVFKKPLRLRLTDPEIEANQVLRVLSKLSGGVSQMKETNSLSWKLAVRNQILQLNCRRYPSSDVGILNQVLANEEYAPLAEIFQRQENLRIIDAGANVGLASIFFRLICPSAQILCLEIDGENARQAKINFALNDMADIVLMQNALWKSDAFLELKKDFRDSSECSYYVEEVDEVSNLMGHDLTYFLNLMNWNQVDLLKIDIEGAERHLFETQKAADCLLERTQHLALEIHDEFNIRNNIQEHLTRHGFTYFDHGDVTIASRKKPS